MLALAVFLLPLTYHGGLLFLFHTKYDSYYMFNFTDAELKTFKRLSSPIKIQNFLDRMPVNYEKNGESNMSPRVVLRAKKCHCLEGALLAAAALWFNGEEPQLLDLRVKPARWIHEDHIVALYKRNGYWGAISKTNHATLRFRDPVYKTIRELALSYFHEYFLDKKGTKVLREYSKPLNLKKFGDKWVTSEENLNFFVQELEDIKHFKIVPDKNLQYVRRADKMERKAGSFLEWQKGDKRTW